MFFFRCVCGSNLKTFKGKITAFDFKIERKNTIQCLGGLRMEDQCVQTESSELSGEESFLPTTAAKT